MRTPVAVLALALQGALGFASPAQGADALAPPAFHLLPGLQQSIQFEDRVISVQVESERIVRTEFEGDRLVLQGLNPGRTRLQLELAESRSPLVITVLVDKDTAGLSEAREQPLSPEETGALAAPRQPAAGSPPAVQKSLPAQPAASMRLAGRATQQTFAVDSAAKVEGPIPTDTIQSMSAEPLSTDRLLAPIRISGAGFASDDAAERPVVERNPYHRIVREVSAVPVSDLSLFDAVNRALLLDPEVQAGASDVERALGEIRVAEAGYWPSLDVSAGPENITKSGVLGYDFLLSQMLFDWGRTSSEVTAASAKQRKQVQSLLLTRNDAALELIEICYDLQSARQQLQLLQFFTDRLEGLQRLTRQRTAGGYSDRAEEGRIRQAMGYMQEQHATLLSELREAESQYRILMSLPAGTFPALVEPVDLFRQLADDRTLEQVIARSPGFMEASHEVMLAQAQLDSAEASYKPRLMLEGSSQKYESGGEMTRDSGIALRFRMDTMQGLSAFDRAEMERQNLAAAQWRLDSARRKQQRQFRSYQASKQAQQQRQQALAQQLDQVGTIRDTYREQFVAGLRTIDDLISTEREGYELAIQQIQSINEQQRLIYRAAADLGLLLPLLSGQLEGSLAP